MLHKVTGKFLGMEYGRPYQKSDGTEGKEAFALVQVENKFPKDGVETSSFVDFPFTVYGKSKTFAEGFAVGSRVNVDFELRSRLAKDGRRYTSNQAVFIKLSEPEKEIEF